MEKEITAIVRKADNQFKSFGGTTLRWVRDCFLPLLEGAGYKIVKAQPEDSADPPKCVCCETPVDEVYCVDCYDETRLP